MIYVRFQRLTKTAMTPTRGSTFAAGFDLYADTDREVVVEPGETVPFYTGLALEIPGGYCGKIYSRSGLSTKYGLRLANGVAVVDSDYRGNIGIPMHNDSDKPVTVMPHERLAQIHRDVAHIPLALSLVGDVFGHLQAHGGLVQGGVDGVSQIAGVAGLIEIVSVVAEEG